VVDIVEHVHNAVIEEDGGNGVPVVLGIVFETIGDVLKEGGDDLLLIGRNVFNDHTIDVLVSLPPLVKIGSMLRVFGIVRADEEVATKATSAVRDVLSRKSKRKERG
jgi:hypothetical protein